MNNTHATPDSSTLTLSITIDQTNLILEALGQLPFIKVYELIASLQAQAKRQLEGPPQASAAASTPTIVEAAGGE